MPTYVTHLYIIFYSSIVFFFFFFFFLTYQKCYTFLQAQVFFKKMDKSSPSSKNTFQLSYGVSSWGNRKGSQSSCAVFRCSKNFKSSTFSQGRKFFHKLFENMAALPSFWTTTFFSPSPIGRLFGRDRQTILSKCSLLERRCTCHPMLLLKSWLFEISISNCLNCIHNCDDHSLLDFKIRSSIYETFHISLHIHSSQAH